MEIKGFKKLRIWYKYYKPIKVVDCEKSHLKEYNIHNDGEQKAYHYLHSLRGYNVMKVDKRHINAINQWLKRFKFQQVIGIVGAPDFFCYKISTISEKRDGEYIFVEVKQKEDGLRGNQLKWLQQNPKVNYCVLYMKGD